LTKLCNLLVSQNGRIRLSSRSGVFHRTGTLLTQKIHGNTIVNGNHVVEPVRYAVIGVTDIIGGEFLVPVNVS